MKGRENKKILSKIGKLFDFFENIYFRHAYFEELSESHRKEVNKSMRLYSENERLAKENTHLLGKISELEKGMNNFETNSKYQELLEAKLGVEKQMYGQRIEYEKHVQEIRIEVNNRRKKIDELGRLVSHLKKDKKEIMRFADYIVREKSAEPLIEFLKNSKIPYVLLDSRTQKIIDYNQSFVAELGINGNVELRKQSYLSILNGRENKENLKIGLKKFLDTDEKKEFDVYHEKNRKKISLHITKQKPVGILIDFSFFGKKKEARIITCIPLIVEKASTWQRYHPHFLDEVMVGALKEEDDFLNLYASEYKDVLSGLVRYGWKAENIEDAERGKTKKEAFYFLRSEYLKLEAAVEKKRKTERRKKARIRLTALENNPRRLENMINRLAERGLDRKELEKVVKDRDLFYTDVRVKYLDILKKYKNSGDRKKRKKNRKYIFGFGIMKRLVKG